MTPQKGPIVFDLDEAHGPSPAEAPVVPEPAAAPPAMARALRVGARRPSWGGRLFWGAALGLIGMMVSVAAWDFVMGLLARSPVLGWTAAGLSGLLLALALVAILREGVALRRLRRLDDLRAQAGQVATLTEARALGGRIAALYAARPEMRWSAARLAEAADTAFDAPAHLALVEAHLMAPLDAQATQEVEAAARQVATVTAFVPLALADLVVALLANLRMIRRIAQIYGGRGGALGSWRLMRAVMAHLVATGAVAVGDDLIGSVAGGSVLSKLSRRFGEGLVNGALTARVGVAAIEVCRPLPFTVEKRPPVAGIIRRAVTGVFGKTAG